MLMHNSILSAGVTVITTGACLTESSKHGRCYIGISLWENISPHQSDVITQTQVKLVSTMVILRATNIIGYCSQGLPA